MFKLFSKVALSVNPKVLKEKLWNNRSFTISVLGTACMFFANIIGKNILDDKSFGIYGLFLTILAIIYTFGLFAFDSIFIRTMKIIRGSLYLRRDLLISFILMQVILILVAELVIQREYFPYLSLTQMIALHTGIVLSLVSYNILRFSNFLILSQLMNNFWKMVLLFLFVISLSTLKQENGISLLMTSLCYIIFVFGLVSISCVMKFCEIRIVQFTEKINAFSLFFGFLVANSTMALIGYGEKLLVNERFGLEVLGEYFFLSTLILSPLLMIQQYLVFKEMPILKKNSSGQFIIRRLIYIMSLTLVMTILICLSVFIGIWIFPELFAVKLRSTLIIIIGGVGLLRVFYSYLSTISTLYLPIRNLHIFNISFLFILAVTTFLLLPIVDNIYKFTLLLTGLWFLRCLLLIILIYAKENFLLLKIGRNFFAQMI